MAGAARALVVVSVTDGTPVVEGLERVVVIAVCEARPRPIGPILIVWPLTMSVVWRAPGPKVKVVESMIAMEEPISVNVMLATVPRRVRRPLRGMPAVVPAKMMPRDPRVTVLLSMRVVVECMEGLNV